MIDLSVDWSGVTKEDIYNLNEAIIKNAIDDYCYGRWLIEKSKIKLQTETSYNKKLVLKQKIAQGEKFIEEAKAFFKSEWIMSLLGTYVPPSDIIYAAERTYQRRRAEYDKRVEQKRRRLAKISAPIIDD